MSGYHHAPPRRIPISALLLAGVLGALAATLIAVVLARHPVKIADTGLALVCFHVQSPDEPEGLRQASSKKPMPSFLCEGRQQ